MAIDWEIHGLAFGNCNCDYSCPCQFHALPTHGDCKGVGFFRIDQGHFDGTPLDGLKVGGVYAWPGPIHEGHGKCQIFIDAKADQAQRAALLKISMGEEAEPFSNVFRSPVGCRCRCGTTSRTGNDFGATVIDAHGYRFFSGSL